jgi:ABC-type transport system involved in Fe-S cluster assembly fused permease/ATPase subunit
VLLFPVPGVLFFRFSVSYSDVVICVTLFLYSFFTVRISVSLQFLYLC